MARARMIKPHFLRSRSMRAVSRMARLTFIQLWLVADDAGRVDAHPLALARTLYPGDAEAVDLLPGWLAELERQHCVERYTVNRTDYLRIVNWQRHQRISHPTPSRLPARPVGFRKDSGGLQEALASEREMSSTDRALTPDAQIPERFRKPPEALRQNPKEPDGPGISPVFPSASGSDGFFRRVTSAAQRAFAGTPSLGRVPGDEAPTAARCRRP